MADPSSSDIPRIFLWCVPRSCSTAFLKMMSFVDGAEVWFEPYVMSFYQKFFLSQSIENEAIAGFLSKVKANYNLLSGTDQLPVSTFSYESTKDLFEGKPKNPDAKFIFVKDMAHCIHDMYQFLPQKVPWKYVFLIRHPRRFVPSYLNLMKQIQSDSQCEDEMVHNPLLHGGKDQILALWKHVRENIDPDPIVIDADDMIKKPGEILPRLFGHLGIPWKDSYINWSEGDAIVKTWANANEFLSVRSVHERALASSHFVAVEKPLPDIKDLHSDAVQLVDMFMPGYEEMYKHTVK